MKITKIKINNFKFHKNIEFDINGNLLIYGENGVGKSSIFEALKSNLYANKILEEDINKIYINRDNVSDNLIVNIKIDEQNFINRIDNDLVDELKLEDSIIYMANEKTLNSVLNNNFYKVLNNNFKFEFPKLEELLLDIYNAFEVEINRNINDENKSIIYIDKRIEVDEKFKIKFDEIFDINYINNIILNKFDENFEIEFKIGPSSIDENNKLIRPKISIKIKGIDEHNIYNHLNEAKLKLIPIVIYFSLAKKFEEDKNIKLLILDDFLTSLDMANRKLIINYILDDFNSYQIMILTHNFQFFNLIKKLTKNWDIKKLYYSEVLNKSLIIDQDKSYIPQAKERRDAGDLESCGNFLRKEFERIANEFENLLELGRVEDLGNIIDALQKNKIYFKKPLKNINLFYIKLQEIIMSDKSDSIKIDKIKKELSKIINTKIDLNEKIIDAKGEEKNKNFSVCISKINFYNGILLNPLSHNHDEIEKYGKECANVMILLENINKGLIKLKENNYS